MRYYRFSNNGFSQVDYFDERFQLARRFGQTLRRTTGGSLAHVAKDGRQLHTEETKKVAELFAYGLAIDYARQSLNIPVERFFFFDGSGARADFRAKVGCNELLESGANVTALPLGGTVFNLEVKGYTGWESFRADSESGRTLLYQVYKKANAAKRGSFAALIACLAGVSDAQLPSKGCRVVVADPGLPLTLSEDDRSARILQELLRDTMRIGLWPTAWHILEWLKALGGGEFTRSHESAQRSLSSFAGTTQHTTLSRNYGGQVYQGREFNEAIYLMGARGRRGMTRTEAEARVRNRDLGWFWFAGIDQRLIRAIPQHDRDALLNYHQQYDQQARAQSGTLVEYIEPDSALEDAAINSLRTQLNSVGGW